MVVVTELLIKKYTEGNDSDIIYRSLFKYNISGEQNFILYDMYPLIFKFQINIQMYIL